MGYETNILLVHRRAAEFRSHTAGLCEQMSWCSLGTTSCSRLFRDGDTCAPELVGEVHSDERTASITTSSHCSADSTGGAKMCNYSVCESRHVAMRYTAMQESAQWLEAMCFFKGFLTRWDHPLVWS